jgi:CheY-like chemotaxis protein
MLSGIRVLIVEDEPSVAATLCDAVEDAGGEVVGIAATVSEARRLIKVLTFNVAVLDLHLSDGDVTPVLEALHARRAPTIVYSGGELPAKVRQRHPDLVALRKPVLPGRIVADPPGAKEGRMTHAVTARAQLAPRLRRRTNLPCVGWTCGRSWVRAASVEGHPGVNALAMQAGGRHIDELMQALREP